MNNVGNDIDFKGHKATNIGNISYDYVQWNFAGTVPNGLKGSVKIGVGTNETKRIVGISGRTTSGSFNITFKKGSTSVATPTISSTDTNTSNLNVSLADGDLLNFEVTSVSSAEDIFELGFIIEKTGL